MSPKNVRCVFCFATGNFLLRVESSKEGRRLTTCFRCAEIVNLLAPDLVQESGFYNLATRKERKQGVKAALRVVKKAEKATK